MSHPTSPLEANFTNIVRTAFAPIDCSRRTTAEQEVLALITPLAKLGRFEAAAYFFQVIVLQLAYRVGG